MKKVLLMTAAIALFAVPAMASIVNTKHNLSASSTATTKSLANETQICKFCHTPHNATPDVPLWNRTNPAAATTGYTLSASLNHVVPVNLAADSISRFCLSCHEGGAVIGARVLQGGPVTDVTGGDAVSAAATIGLDLTNDHPVGFQVVDATDTKIYTLAVMKQVGNDLKFFGAGADYMECATCHDVHGGVLGTKFLRKTNVASALCLTCHDK